MGDTQWGREGHLKTEVEMGIYKTISQGTLGTTPPPHNKLGEAGRDSTLELLEEAKPLTLGL